MLKKRSNSFWKQKDPQNIHIWIKIAKIPHIKPGLIYSIRFDLIYLTMAFLKNKLNLILIAVLDNEVFYLHLKI